MIAPSQNCINSGRISSIFGASITISSFMDVSSSILNGIGTSGFTNVEKRSVIFPPATLTAPISMILFLSGLNPVVSRSNTTYVSSRLCPFESVIISFRSSTRYASTPYMTLKSSSGLSAWFASGNAWTSPWSVMAIALCPHFIARFTISLHSDTPSISLILV